MCLKADKSVDVGNVVCNADAISNFTGMTIYVPNDAPVSFIAAGQPWPFAEITYVPSF